MRRNGPGRTMRLLMLLCALSTSAGCRRISAEPRCTELRPQPAPLPPEILLLMQPDSTQLLNEASTWSNDSKQLLDSVKTN